MENNAYNLRFTLITCSFFARFLNSFIESSPTDREKVHIQSELEEAGLDIAPLKKLLSQVTH